MNRYLVIKIGGSDIMGDLISKALDPLVYWGDEETPDTINQPRSSSKGTVIMFNFLSTASIDEIMFALKDIAIANFVVTEISDDTFRANLSERLDQNMMLNKFSASEKTLDDMNTKELQEELDYALEKQLFERAAEIRDKMKSISNKV